MSQPDIHLYTAATMNGYKPVIFLEEASVPYDLTFIDFAKSRFGPCAQACRNALVSIRDFDQSDIVFAKRFLARFVFGPEGDNDGPKLCL